MSPEPLSLHAQPVGSRLASEGLDALRRRLLPAEYDPIFMAGMAEGLRRSRAGAAGALEKAAVELEQSRREALAELPRTAIELALEISKELLRKELKAGRYDLEDIVREALTIADARHVPCTVHLHPDDFEALRELRFNAGVSLEPDPGLGRASVRVRAPQGLLVRDLRDVLDTIGKNLREMGA